MEHKAAELVKHRAKILALAEKAGIKHIYFCNPVFRPWCEEDDFVECLISLSADALKVPDYRAKLSNFMADFKSTLHFRVTLAFLDEKKESMNDMPNQLKMVYQQMLDTLIPLEELTNDRRLLDQFTEKAESIRQTSPQAIPANTTAEAKAEESQQESQAGSPPPLKKQRTEPPPSSFFSQNAAPERTNTKVLSPESKAALDHILSLDPDQFQLAADAIENAKKEKAIKGDYVHLAHLENHN